MHRISLCVSHTDLQDRTSATSRPPSCFFLVLVVHTNTHTSSPPYFHMVTPHADTHPWLIIDPSPLVWLGKIVVLPSNALGSRDSHSHVTQRAASWAHSLQNSQEGISWEAHNCGVEFSGQCTTFSRPTTDKSGIRLVLVTGGETDAVEISLVGRKSRL